ncbi:MAG: DUF6531 domain-containing protein [Acidimicrobiales bacterium]
MTRQDVGPFGEASMPPDRGGSPPRVVPDHDPSRQAPAGRFPRAWASRLRAGAIASVSALVLGGLLVAVPALPAAAASHAASSSQRLSSHAKPRRAGSDPATIGPERPWEEPMLSTAGGAGRTSAGGTLPLDDPDPSWAAASGTLPSGVGELYAVDCPAAEECLAAGLTTGGDGIVVETVDGGLTWTTPSLPSSVELVAIGCTNASTCVTGGAGGELFEQTSLGGAFSAVEDEPSVSRIDKISCALGGQTCAAIAGGTDDEVAVSTDVGSGGEAWSVVDLGRYVPFAAVQCFDDGVCVAVGDSSPGPTGIAYTTDDWSSVSYSEDPNDLTGLIASQAISCQFEGSQDTPDLSCLLEGDSSATATWDISEDSWSWSETSSPPGSEEASAVLCVNQATCAAATFAGSPRQASLSYTTDGGADWSSETIPSASEYLASIACSPSAFCMAAGLATGGSGEVLVDGGDALSSAPVGGVPTTAEIRGAGSPSEPKCTCQSTGEPVNTETGDFYGTTTDLSVPGPGVPLQLTRTYDSDAATAGDSSALGTGWSYNLGVSLAFGSGSPPATATLSEEDGDLITFDYDSSEPWCPPSTQDNYCPAAPRVIATLDESGGVWTFTRDLSGTTTMVFDSSGVLQSVADTAGDTLTYTAQDGGSGSCPASFTSCTTWASSSSGRELTLGFSSGELVAAMASDGSSTSDEATYCYYGQACASGGSGQTGELYSETAPDGVTTSYTYDSSNELLTETSPAGTLTNTYTSGQVSEQEDPDRQVTELAYEGEPFGAGGTTTVETFPTGTSGAFDQVQYEFRFGELVGKATGSSASVSYMPDPVSTLPATTTDGNGETTTDTYESFDAAGGGPLTSGDLVSSVDALGNTTEYSYNDLNEAWCEVDPAEVADGTACPSSEPSTPPEAGSGLATAACTSATASFPCLGATITYYDSAGDPFAVSDPLGYTSVTSYTSSGEGVPSGLAYCSLDAYSYSVGGVSCQPYGESQPAGSTSSVFDSSGDAVSATSASGGTTTYSYGESSYPSLPTVTTAPDGTVTTDTYDSAGRLTKQVETFAGYSATSVTAYDSDGRPYCSISPLAYSQGYTSCVSPAPTSPPSTSAADPWAGQTITIYDSDSRPAYTVNPLGGVSETAYDQAGEAYCTIGPSVYGTDTVEYPDGLYCPSTPPSSPPVPGSDPDLGMTITSYDDEGLAVQVTNPLGGITLTGYDPAGNVLTTTTESDSSSAPDVVTSYQYDADERVVATTTASGTSQSFYDPDGDVYCSVSAKDDASFACPDWQAGWIEAPPAPASLYSGGDPSASEVTTSFYDAGGDLVQTTNPDDETTVSSYDGDGQAYCSVDPVNYAAGAECAAYGGSQPTGTTSSTFDAAGLTVSSTDQLGDVTSYGFDDEGNLLTTTNPDGRVTTDCYYYEDSTGACAQSAPAGGGTADSLYETTTPPSTADPSGQTTKYTYYPGGSPDATTTPAGTTTDGYDAMGDLTSQDYSGTATGYSAPADVSYTINPDGSRAEMTDGTGTTAYSYDAMGDELSQDFTAGYLNGFADSDISYSYYSTGQTESVVYPSYSGHSDPTATYAYNSAGEMASVADWLGNTVSFTYDPDGNLEGQDNTPGSGTNSSTSFTYDAADYDIGAVTSYSCSGGSGTLTEDFGEGSGGSSNDDGQLSSYGVSYGADCSGSTLSRDYGYDAAGRLDYEGSSTGSPDVAYDAAGNLTEMTAAGAGGFATSYQCFDDLGQVTAAYATDTCSGTPAASYGYDSLGDMTSATSGTATTDYGYNQLGEMTSAAVPSAPVVGYSYDGDGLLAGRAQPIHGWSPPVAADPHSLEGISCPSQTMCVAVDDDGGVVAYDGTSYSYTSGVDSTRPLTSVSCASTSFCAAVDSSGNVLTYNGSTWSVPDDIDSTRSLTSVSCPSSSFCAAVDSSGNVVTYDGSTWSSPSDIDSTRSLTSVSCPSSSFCAAVDSSGNVVTYDGSTWSSSSDIDSTRSLTSVSCPSSSFCAAVGSSGRAVTYNGSTWSVADADGSKALSAVVCVSSTLCMATDSDGNAVQYSTYGWVVKSIDGSTALTAIAYPNSYYDFAVDAAGDILSYTWRNDDIQLTWDTTGATPVVASASAYDYIYGPAGEPVEQVGTFFPSYPSPAFMSYVAADSTWVLTNTAGHLVGFYGYDAFGNLAFGTVESSFGYGGQYADTSPSLSGLDNMRARWYDPATGTFTTLDPDFSATDQAYGYAGGDPVGETDASGESTHGYCLGGGGQVGYGVASGEINFCLMEDYPSPLKTTGGYNTYNNIGVVTISSREATGTPSFSLTSLLRGLASAELSISMVNTNAKTLNILRGTYVLESGSGELPLAALGPVEAGLGAGFALLVGTGSNTGILGGWYSFLAGANVAGIGIDIEACDEVHIGVSIFHVTGNWFSQIWGRGEAASIRAAIGAADTTIATVLGVNPQLFPFA